MNSKRPILVTGAPRSGTSWVGRILAADPTVRYVHEPFNISGPPCRCGVKLDHWFQYAAADDVALYRHIQHLIASPVHRIQIENAVAALSSRHWKDGMKQLKRATSSLGTKRVLVKDPLAVFSTEWMATQFEMEVIVLIRHPAGVVSSYKELGWTHPFLHFVQQPALVHDCLSVFAAEIEVFTLEPRELIEQISLLWRLIHFHVHKQQQAHPDWLFVRYEDLVRDPLAGFSHIFQYVDLPFTETARRRLLSTSSGQMAVDDLYSIQRDSRAVADRWKLRLSGDEIARIKNDTESVSSLFYSQDEW